MRTAAALIALLIVGVLAGGSPASAASSCPTLTFLNYGHLAYEATAIPPTVSISAGSALGSGTVD